MDARNSTKPSEHFIGTYYALLCGIEEGATETIIANKHAGLAILRCIESLNFCDITILSREMFLNAMRVANAEHLIAEYERSFSRLQFIIVTNRNSGNRFLIDLGSCCGTTLLNCQTLNTDYNLKKIAKELNFFLIKAGTNCLTDNIHGKMYSHYQSFDNRKNITISLNESAKAELPNPNQNSEILLQSGLNGYKWYPLLQLQQDIRIGVNMFTLNADLTLKFKRGSESTISLPKPKVAPSHSTFDEIYVELPPKKITEVPSQVPKSDHGQYTIFAPPKNINSDSALIANFNKLLSVNPHGISEYNFALNNVIEQIKQAGGVEKMKGYPEAFKCPITQEPMRDPVIDIYGHTYEASATASLKRSPITNLNYPNEHKFKSNTQLKIIIDLFFKIKGVDRNEPIMTMQTEAPKFGKNA